MKNTNQVRNNRNSRPGITQGIIASDAAKIGKQLCLFKDEIEALSLLINWENEQDIEQSQTATAYCKEGVLCIMQSTCDLVLAAAQNGGANSDKAKALLPIISKLLPGRLPTTRPSSITMLPPKPAADEDNFRVDGKYKLELAINQTHALLELLFNNLDHENAETFHRDNSILAAGLQTLIGLSRSQLWTAFENLHVSKL